MLSAAQKAFAAYVEHRQQLCVKADNHRTDNHADDNAHNYCAAVAAAGTVGFARADILPRKSRDSNVEALGGDMRKLLDFQHCGVALDARCAEGVDKAL